MTRYPRLPETLIALEEETLAKWSEEGLFRRTMERRSGAAPFVFFEGPPTANGRPGLHHIISRAIKDLICRYQSMRGRSVTRIAGWDTHGLPVEIEAEKRLGISGKTEIEAFGISRFNDVCRESVFTYKEEWERLSERIGYWLDYSRPYVTFHADYIESVWWILKRLADRGLLYRGHKSVPYCPRCGTALSSHEVAQGYEDVEDPSLFFLCPLVGEGESAGLGGAALLVWTTTPWTVPSNAGVAVHPELVYVEARHDGRRVVLAEARVEGVLGKGAEVLRRFPASELVGLRYRRPLDVVPAPEGSGAGWTVLPADFVSASEGTGIVHMAPAFGADDYVAGQRHGLPFLNPLDDRARFREEIPLVGGLFVKDADPLLVSALEERGHLFRIDRVVHSYPHCWRCESPLIHMARDSWFAATSSMKEEMLRNNATVNWHPPEVGEGRFGEWLSNNVDWALSRDRFWGTPLPVWICDENPETVTWIGGIGELREHAGPLADDFDPHRPDIDEVRWPCEDPGCPGTMRRSPAVVDVWFDSGAMPYAQWHYPFEREEEWKSHFPADFICEGLDQTRGWFYSLMAISTMLGLGSSYLNVIVNGLILDAEGRKMSKSKGNAVDPWDAVADVGADGLRLHLLTASNPSAAKRYDPQGVREMARRHFDTLFNSYRFFALYANVERWEPRDDDPGPADRPVIDRWLLSRLHSLILDVRTELDDYQITPAFRAALDFLSEDLSNWYVRRCRSRFWGKGNAQEGRAAFRTLWEALVSVLRMMAPLTPFSSDWMHRALVGTSVHLSDFPEPDAALRDPGLDREMEAARLLASLGRAAREEARIRVRQPLRRLHAVLPGGLELREELRDLVREELNVKEIDLLASGDALMTLAAKPKYRGLGPRFRGGAEEAASAIRALPPESLALFRGGGAVEIEVQGESLPLRSEDFDIVEEAREGLVVRSDRGCTVALETTLDEDLAREGLARELVNRVQRLRKEAGLDVTDRIHLGISGSGEVVAVVESFRDFIAGETLAVAMTADGEGGDEDYEAVREVDLAGRAAVIGLNRAPAHSRG